MSVPVDLHAGAEDDLLEAFKWYEKKREGLGEDFIGAAAKFFDRISNSPELYAKVFRNVRRGKLRRFPYLVYYRYLSDKVEVLAVLHSSRGKAAIMGRLR